MGRGPLRSWFNPPESGPKSRDLTELFDAYPRQGDMQLKKYFPRHLQRVLQWSGEVRLCLVCLYDDRPNTEAIGLLPPGLGDFSFFVLPELSSERDYVITHSVYVVCL